MPVKLDKADYWFSRYIRLRDKKCMRCGSLVQFNANGDPISHQASHFQGRAKEATRFDPENVDTLCGGCHRYLTANPYEHVQFQVKLKGQAIVDAIVLRSHQYMKKDRKMQAIIWQKAYKTLKEKQ